MFKKYENKKHKDQANEFLHELGEFVLSFERVCESMRFAIILMLRSQGLNNENMAHVIVGDKSSADLQMLVGAFYMEMPNQDDEDKKAVKKLLKRIKDTTEKRNIILHNSWDLGHIASWGTEIMAVATRYRTKQNSGAIIEPHGINPSYLRELSIDLTEIQILMQRFITCIVQPQLKVTEELNKPC